ncbi:MAG: tRNA-dihydrouridine synthase [Candidatus Microsaccharimonas sp.]
MKNFWQDLPKPFFILAPMEAVTDVVFRHVVAKAAAPDVYFTEFTNTDSYVSPKGQHSTKSRLAYTDDEQPIVAHIWGKTPEHFRQMAHGMKEKGFVGIDINTGCPAKDVVKNGAGSGLIRTPELMAEIIAATKEAGLPVSIKARLGDVRPEEFKEWLAFLLKQDIANLTIHLRTRKEMSKVPAHYELISEIKKLRDDIAPQTLLTINGDIRDRTHGLELVEKYGVDGVMIARGVFTNPYAFEHEPKEHSREELIDLLKLQLDLYDKYVEEFGPKPFDTLKRFFKIYIRDFEGAAELRDILMHTKSTDEVRGILIQHK